MDGETEKMNTSVGKMQKRRVLMADGRRYLVYYTFEKGSKPPASAGGSADLGLRNADFGLNFSPKTNPQSQIPNSQSNRSPATAGGSDPEGKNV